MKPDSERMRWLVSIGIVLLFLGAGCVSGQDTSRREISLDGEWWFRPDLAATNQWKTVHVPSTFQSHEGIDFHGVGWYRKSLNSIPELGHKRVLLHFEAAATEAEVWLDGERIGSHLGGWTPFRFDVTSHLADALRGSHELLVRLDEKVGHNTQGFLPVVAPHFGGLWQSVKLLVVPRTYCDDLGLLAVGDPKNGRLRVDVPLAGSARESVTTATLRCRLRGEEQWTLLAPAIRRSGDILQLNATIPEARPWSPAAPNLYELDIALPSGDRIQTRAAFRSIAAFGSELRFNGKPLQIRGLLNWGYSPPLLAPNPGEAVWRSELDLARSRGFNLMKFCLWIPPRRYLELADEMGMLTWMEYPTWHPDFSEKQLEPLRREFREFFRLDRNHPSIVLRSLTCETGPSADLNVIRRLYDEAHQMIPGALVEDDSSWIAWNRISDFYDDHPYGNNDTWVSTLHGFRTHILAHGLKPLVLGESMAADTWPDRHALLNRLGSERPWWAPGVLDDMPRWKARMTTLTGPGGLEELLPDSLRYGMLMRKYQAEAFRREMPYGGYVMSVIRDIPNASMGLLDYVGRPKWSEADWSWQRDTICLLKTEADRRSFASGEPLSATVLLSHFGTEPIDYGKLDVTLETIGEPDVPLEKVERRDIQQAPGTLAKLVTVDWPLPRIDHPVHLLVRAELKTEHGDFQNRWPLWVVPKRRAGALERVEVHHSLANSVSQELFPGCPEFDARDSNAVVIASEFDKALMRFLEKGGRVLFLPDGATNSLSLKEHWFLRGGPYIPHSAVSDVVPRDLLIELQHFDLSSKVISDVPHLDSMDPILLLWDTHDRKDGVHTHAIIYETRVGKGHLLVSAAGHAGSTNAAGRWLLDVLIAHLRNGPAPNHSLPPDALPARPSS